MAQKVTAMDIRSATALAGHVENVAEFCRRQQISRQTFYKFRARFKEEGLEGLTDRSRRPLSSPGQTSAEVEELVLRQRKQLLEQGLDHGPHSIRWSLQRQGRAGLLLPRPDCRPRRDGIEVSRPARLSRACTRSSAG